MSGDHYEVEEIIKRTVNPAGLVEYLVKWKDWGSHYNSWVKAHDMACPSFIEEFEKENIAKETLNPFQRGYEAEKIVGSKFKEQPYFLLKMHDKQGYEWVSSSVLRQECPQLLIKYYESCIQWEHPKEKTIPKDDNRNIKKS